MTTQEIENKVKAFEKNCGYKLENWEREFAYFWYEEANCYVFVGEPDLCSEYASDFCNAYYNSKY